MGGDAGTLPILKKYFVTFSSHRETKEINETFLHAVAVAVAPGCSFDHSTVDSKDISAFS